jgi:4-hydroxymandelate oxidase
VVLATTVLGMPAAAPLCTCPVGTQTMFHPDGERATAAGARARSLPAVIGCMTSVPFADVSAVTDRWAVQIYPFADRTITHEIMFAALEAGASAVVYTADVPVSGRRLRDQRNGFTGLVDARPHPVSPKLEGADLWAAWTPTYTWDDIGALVAAAGVPFGIKGVLHPDDAARAVDAGVQTVWVSSHGGRQLDDAIAPLDALPRIADAVGGAAEIVIDGSPVSGADVAKALALGADVVAIGRAAMWGLAAAGAAGVARVLELLVAQLENVLLLMGLEDPHALTRADVAYVPDLRRRLGEAAQAAP